MKQQQTHLAMHAYVALLGSRRQEVCSSLVAYARTFPQKEWSAVNVAFGLPWVNHEYVVPPIP